MDQDGPAHGSAEPEPILAPLDAGFGVDVQDCMPMTVGGHFGQFPFHNRHWDAILDVHAEPYIQRFQDGFGRTTRFGRTMGWAIPAHLQLVASSIASLCRLVYFGPIYHVNSEFLAHSYISLILDIIRLIYRFSWCRFSFTLVSFSAKRLVYLLLVEYYYSNRYMHCKHD